MGMAYGNYCSSGRGVMQNVAVVGPTKSLNDLAMALVSLNLSKAESALSLKRRVPSKGMSMSDAWTASEKSVFLNQA